MQQLYNIFARVGFELSTAWSNRSLKVSRFAYISSKLLNSENALKTLNFRLEKMYQFELPIEKSTRTILKIKKINKVSKIYPRDFAKIKHRPL